MNNQLHIINNIDVLTKDIQKVGLTPGLLEQNQDTIRGISAMVGLEPRQVVLFVAAFKLCFDQGEVTLGDLAKLVRIDFVGMPLLIQDMQELEKAGLIKRTGNKENTAPVNFTYGICPRVRQRLLNNESVEPKTLDNLSLNEIFKQTFELVRFSNHYHKSNVELISEFSHLLSQNKGNAFIRHMINALEDDVEKLFLCFLCHKVVSHAAVVVMTDLIEELFRERSIQHALMSKLFTGESPLLQKGFIKVNDVDELSRLIMLTEQTRSLMETGSVQSAQNASRHEAICSWKNIHSRELFHNPKETEALEKIRNILLPGKFEKFSRELTSRGMARGINILFHGASGTGKTETVYQLARSLQKDLFVVDISKTRDKYFGNSEKLITQVFSDYAACVSASDNPPILFFNEADAIFSTRKNVLEGNVAQTENAMQNILLQEMERLQGILIATTNLNANFDKAFDRRFLFGVRFNHPNEKALRKIWKSRMPELKPSEIGFLAQNFYLTGAQIDNILRKALIDQYAIGKQLVLDDIVTYCEHELQYNKPHPVMGFKS